MLIGFGMAVSAAAVHEAATDIGQWLGSSWFYLIAGVALFGMISCTLGMMGSCYQKKFLLILYVLSLLLLILFEGFVIFVMSTTSLDQVLTDNWDGLNDSLQQTISDDFDCDPLVPRECINAAKGDAENIRNVMYYICALLIVGQLVMLSITTLNMVGLRKKKRKIKVLLGLSTPITPSTPSPQLERIESSEYGKVRWKKESKRELRARGILV